MIEDIILKKSYIKALVVATTLAIPFAIYSTPALAALKAEANQSVATASERTYDTEIKIYAKFKIFNSCECEDNRSVVLCAFKAIKSFSFTW
ncbi:hypothetical protein [Bacillus wiedmannii]|uniref:hypothetical protein n=1 Tax=Bacillus wiedmannii TaxID=1890302 RepID=UPI00352AE9BF